MLKGLARFSELARCSSGLPDMELPEGRRAFLNVLEDNNRLLEAQRLFREVSGSLALAAVNSPVSQIPEYSPIQKCATIPSTPSANAPNAIRSRQPGRSGSRRASGPTM